jgi:hypothetical protein
MKRNRNSGAYCRKKEKWREKSRRMCKDNVTEEDRNMSFKTCRISKIDHRSAAFAAGLTPFKNMRRKEGRRMILERYKMAPLLKHTRLR